MRMGIGHNSYYRNYYISELEKGLSKSLRETLHTITEQEALETYYMDGDEQSKNECVLTKDATKETLFQNDGVKELITNPKENYLQVIRKKGNYLITEYLHTPTKGNPQEQEDKQEMILDVSYYELREDAEKKLGEEIEENIRFSPEEFFSSQQIRPTYVGRIATYQGKEGTSKVLKLRSEEQIEGVMQEIETVPLHHAENIPSYTIMQNYMDIKIRTIIEERKKNKPYVKRKTYLKNPS